MTQCYFCAPGTVKLRVLAPISFRGHMRTLRSFALVAMVGSLPLTAYRSPLTAQSSGGLPTHAPINPIATSRSGLYFQPYVERNAGWRLAVSLDYANMIEGGESSRAKYLLDAEVGRLDLAASRDLGSRTFILLNASAQTAGDGFLDHFLDWYHGILGIPFPERDARPHNQFLYGMALPDGRVIFRNKSGGFLGDTRLGLGLRYNDRVQSLISVTLPTSTGPRGYGRGAASISAIHTVRTHLTRGLIYEGSLGTGYTPKHGDLSAYQREIFLSLTSGLRLQFWGPLSLYGNLFYHSPYYEGTTVTGMDRSELSLDYGGVFRSKGGREIKLGMTEDPRPAGPAVDLVFKFGVGW